MTDPLASILISLKVATAATLLDLLVGLPLAWVLAYGRFRGHRLLDVLVNLPIVLPPTVLGYYLLVLLGRGGPIGAALGWLGLGTIIFTPYAAILAAAAVSLPLLVQAARIALESVPAEAVEAARVSGAGPAAVLRYILLPLAWPGISVGVLLAFARAMGEFGATLMVAGNIPGRTQTVPLAIYAAVQAGRMEEANLLSLLLMAVVGLAMWAVLRWGRPSRLSPWSRI